MRKVGVGIIGCGNISTSYLKAARRFPVLRGEVGAEGTGGDASVREEGQDNG